MQSNAFESTGDEYYHYSPAKDYSYDYSSDNVVFVPKTFGYESKNGTYDVFFNFNCDELEVIIEEYDNQTLLANYKIDISADTINTILSLQNSLSYEELYFQYSTIYSEDILNSIHVMDELFKQVTHKSMINWLVI